MNFVLEPVIGEGFVNREEILEDMMSELTNPESKIGFALYGIRRVGKSSVLKELHARIGKKEQIVPIYINLWDLIADDLIIFFKTLRNKIIDAYRPKLGIKYKTGELIKLPVKFLRDIIRSSKISIKLGEDIEAILKIDEQKADSNELIDGVFELAEKLAKETNTKCVLLIDEFPSLIDLKLNGKKVGEPIIRKLRTIDESQERTVLCISGSIRKTMDLVAFSSTSAFYKQLVVKIVDPLKKEYVKELLLKHLKKENITDEAINAIYKFSNGIPFYVQFIGRTLQKKTDIDRGDVEAAINDFMSQEGNLIFSRDFNVLSAKERIILKEMAAGGLKSPSDIAKKTGQASAAISMYLGYLEEKGIIIKKARGIYDFEDPIFKEWIRRKWGEE